MRYIQALLLSVLLTPALSYAAPPKGAVKLPAASIFKSGSFYCGKLKSTFVPGRLISGYFYAHSAERTNLQAEAKRAKGKAKTKLLAQIATLTSEIAARGPICAAGKNGNQALKFDFSGAVGLALNSQPTGQSFASAASVGSNMKKIKADGTTEEVVTQGNVKIERFLTGNGHHMYALFNDKVNLANTAATNGDCLLAEVDTTTGTPTCIETELNSVDWQDRPKNAPIQFDRQGQIYYHGRTNDGHQILRRFLSGNKTDLINDAINLDDFFVLDDGRIILRGSTTITNAKWIRRLTPSGTLAGLYNSAQGEFIYQFPDNNVYMGVYGDSIYAVERYLTASDTTDSQPYMADIGFNGVQYNPVYDIGPFCANGGFNTYQGFCGTLGTMVKGIYTTSDNKVFAIAGYNNVGNLMQYYPTLARPMTVVSNVSLSEAIGDKLVLAGLNSDSKNILTLFNTADGSETQLIGPDNEIEYYHLNYIAATNTILFDGLRFSDNAYVVGQYNLDSMSLSVSSTGGTKLVDLDTIGQ